MIAAIIPAFLMEKKPIINCFTAKNVQWTSVHVGVFCIYKKLIKNLLPDPNIGHHPYGIRVKGKKDLSSDPVGREGGEFYEATFFLGRGNY